MAKIIRLMLCTKDHNERPVQTTLNPQNNNPTKSGMKSKPDRVYHMI